MLVVAAAGVVVWRSQKGPNQDVRARTAAQVFADRWVKSTLAEGAFDGATGAKVATGQAEVTKGMGATPVAVAVTGLERKGRHANAAAKVTWSLPGNRPWTYRSTIPLVQVRDAWLVQWSPSVVNPALGPGDKLVLNRLQPSRASIMGSGGTPLVVDRPVVTVGVQPQRVTDVDGLSTQLAQLLHVDGPGLAARIRAAKPDAFVEVVTLRREEYDPLRAQLQPLPGTVFREGTLPLAPTRVFARSLLGSVGPVTAEIVASSKDRYRAGDVAGLSGLERAYDEQLAGVAGSQVQAMHAVPAAGGTAPATELFSVSAVPGKPLTTTLDDRTQRAADDALAGEARPSALVAIRPSTGEVLAVSQGPGAANGDIALSGHYPPGSSFKIVSTYALLTQGLDPNQNVACPQFATVDGKQFKNAEAETFGDVAFHADFAHSCNTAFVGLSSKLPANVLPDAAAQFGLGGSWSLGVPAFTGSVPAPTTKTEQAAQAFGQGKVLVSPLDMAMVGATAQSGTWRQPRLLPGTTPAPTPDKPLDPAAVPKLQALMREVVTNGTGTAVAAVPGAPVSGKTGTAEFGNDNPPKSHAWFVAYQGDLALSVFVEGGEFGGDTAAPLAAKFLTTLVAPGG